MDFSLIVFAKLIEKSLTKGFSFFTVADFAEKKIYSSSITTKSVLLRHDVDLKPQNSLATAIIENKLGIRGSYYFRMVPESYNVDIIKQIADLGHEVGYHYETMDTVNEKFRINNLKFKNEEERIDEAYKLFCENLEEFRRIYPVKTICMHGSPKSAFDNRDIWKKYDYKQLGIIGEPYFDVDFDKFFYLTDTGRCWNGYKYSVRDKMAQQEHWIKQGLVFKTTNDIIKAIKADRLPLQTMITLHPQRWTNNYFEWSKELVAQRVKNIVKWGLIRLKHQ
ncbi:MAG TPA: hypothetical protein PKW61_05575 [Tenuifilaceae bacterium]|nr:hypothetical protein [Tenuifilaceae bacterium]